MSKILTKFISLAIALCLGISLQAQQVHGTVKDSEGVPVVGAFVLIQGTTQGVSTDLDGAFSIKVDDAQKAVLEISMLGLKTQHVKLDGKLSVDVLLESDANLLEETVVVGYATVKRRDLLGSVSSVNGETLTEQPVTTVSQALAGKMAGVSVTTSEGDPDAEIKIRVRGGGSITQDNSPLYIVDGFPVDNINDISSSQIASIDVLKDAFSTAIYGSRGANGVVIVTTKSGEKGSKISVSLNAYGGTKYMANRQAIQPMNTEQFVKFQYELATLRDNVSDNYTPYFGSFADIDQYTGMAGNDWVDAIFGNTGSTGSVDLAVSGSGEGYNWTLGYAHLSDNAIMTGSNYARDNLHFKGNFQLWKTVSLDFNTRYSNTRIRGAEANGVNDTGTTSGNGRLKHAVSYSPIPLVSSITGEEEDDYGDNAPPLKSVADNDSRKTRGDFNVNAAINWDICKVVRLKIDGGYEDYREGSDRFYGLTTYYVANTATYRDTPANQHKEYFRKKFRNTNTINLDFTSLFTNKDHMLNALIGQELTITRSNTLSLMVENFPTFYDADKAWKLMSSGTTTSADNHYNPDDNMLSFFGRINYDYKHRYSIGATLRADGSSKFAESNRWGIFPSAAVSWTLSNENWMVGAQNWLDQLKLRYSFGTAGNNNIPTGQIDKTYSAVSAGTWMSQSSTYWTAGKILNNPDLKWETTYTHNIGLDFSFFKNKLSGSIELYQNDTKDLLILFPIPGSGYESQYRNIGSTRNRGVELTLNAPVITKQNFSLSIGGNIAYNKNVVTDLGGLASLTAQSYWASSEIGDDYIVQVGNAIGNMYGYRNAGRYEVSDFNYTGGKWVLKEGVVDDSSVIGSQYLRPGALKLKDLDGDNKITVKDREVIGNANPDFQGGFNINAYVYGFDFNMNFNFMIGNQVYNANKIEFTSSRKFNNRNLIKQMDLGNRWTNIDWTTGALIDDPATLAAVNENTTMWSPCMGQAVFSDWAVEDASFLRLQNATIGYTIPEKLTSKIFIRKIRFYVTGTNLFCITKYSGYDPEVDTRRATSLTPGVDYSAYPKSIGWVAGINLTF